MQIIQEKMSRLFEVNRSLTQSLHLEDVLKKLGFWCKNLKTLASNL